MFRKINLLTLAILYCLIAQAAPPKKVQIRLRLSAANDSSKIELGELEVFSKGLRYTSFPLYQTGITKSNSWELPAEKTVGIYIKLNKQYYFTYLEPGSDVTLHIHENKVDASGPGSEVFNAIANEIKPQFDALVMPNKSSSAPLRDMAEFYAWNAYLDKKSEIIHRIVDKHATAYGVGEVWDVLKTQYIAEIEYRRTEKFLRISGGRTEFNLSQEDINKIYHKFIFNKNFRWLLSQEKESPNISCYLRFVYAIAEVLYPKEDPKNDYLFHSQGRLEKIKIDLRIIDSLTTGPLRDQLVTYMILEKLAKPGLLDVANDFLPQAFSIIRQPEAEKVLIDGLVAYVKEQAGYEVSDLYFLDVKGNPVRRKDMPLKTVVLHIKDIASNGSDSLFQSIVEEFSNQPNVILAEIGHGKSFKDWQKEVRQATPSSSPIVQLYSPQTGDHLDFMATIYAALKTPTMVFYQYRKTSGHKNILMSPDFKLSLRKKRGDTLSAVLEIIRNEAQKFDGPYVRTLADTTFIYSIARTSTRIDTFLNQQLTEIKVPVDQQGNSFLVKIKETPSPSPTNYSMPEKALFLSDIEGNLSSFRDLLINNHVMDSSYNWTFGKGHLVVLGDVFDRGRQVTGCLWLIYMLEQKSRQAGGDVHFVLGNHEVMNLTGDFRYVYPDYQLFAGMFGLSYADLYDHNSILGKWLRSKNIIEVIGGHLVVHGGISPELNSLGLSIEEINNRHRFFLAGQQVAPGDTAMKTILSSKVSPYWYRGYYQKNVKNNKVENLVDSTLSLYKVSKIVTGHTIVNDISALHGGKVIAIDTHHASGDSEALLIEGGNYYRVDLQGMRYKLQ